MDLLVLRAGPGGPQGKTQHYDEDHLESQISSLGPMIFTKRARTDVVMVIIFD